MISKKGTFYLGVLVFIIPFLGFPTFWKMILVVFAGLSLIIYSLKFPIPRKPFNKIKFKKESAVHQSEIVSSNSVDSLDNQEIKTEVKPEPYIQPLPSITKIEPQLKKTRKNTKSAESIKKIKVKE